MSGCWVTWEADIRTRPDITDLEGKLDQTIYRLWQRRDIDDAYHEYDPNRYVVTFTVRVRYGITEVIVKQLAYRALHDALRWTGFALPHGWSTVQPYAWLRFTRWPQAFMWR